MPLPRLTRPTVWVCVCELSDDLNERCPSRAGAGGVAGRAKVTEQLGMLGQSTQSAYVAMNTNRADVAAQNAVLFE